MIDELTQGNEQISQLRKHMADKDEQLKAYKHKSEANVISLNEEINQLKAKVL
jgi:peptidoglycan hydrolase CwlO-like protein